MEFKNIISEWKNYLLFESSYNKILEIVKKLEPKKVIRFHDIDEEIKFEIPRKVKKLLDE